MISDEELCRAAQAWEEARLKLLPAPGDCSFEVSHLFRRKMKKLIERIDHPSRYWLKKCAACFLLVILLSGVGVLTLSREARAAVIGWTRRVFDNISEYRYAGDRSFTAPKNTVYLPSWIPDGFEIYSRYFSKTEGHIFYTTPNGNHAFFLYNLNGSGTMQIGNENGGTEQQVFVGKYSADLYLDAKEGADNALVWEDTERNALFTILAPNTGGELIKMAESVMTREFLNTAVEYNYIGQNAPVPGNTAYLPTWIPDGFEMEEVFDICSGLIVYYENAEGWDISFDFSMDNVGTLLRVKNGNYEKLPVQVGKYSADLYLNQYPDQNNALVWTDEEKEVLFEIYAPLSADELVKMAESVELVARSDINPGS